MGDTEFEEFRQYFDSLPQYIKAPAQIYTLVHDIDLSSDDSPTTEKGPKTCITQDVEDEKQTSSDQGVWEPFSGDLQILIPEREDRNSPKVTRRRRKLPEIPKNPSRRWNPDTRQVSLADEISEAENRQRNACNSGSDLPNTSTLLMINSNQGGGNMNTHWSMGHEDNSFNYYTSRPTNFTLKFPCGIRDDESSPDSEKYTSLDSGHSTIHSDDGSKPYSPQIPSINESFSPSSPSMSGTPFLHLEVLEATHRGLHKFMPRHHDEIEIEIGDAIYMQKEADDLWCEGVNLRTGMQGIFPSAYVVDVDYDDFDPTAKKIKKERYLINYIGSIETLYHKGNEVLCQAVKKLSGHEGYVAAHTRPCILEISDQGIHMLDKGKTTNHVPTQDYFFALKNVSFCGFHPNDHRYFGFVTKHPTLNRFACHVLVSEESTRPIAEAIGRAFQRFYRKFIETAYPIEDIYLE